MVSRAALHQRQQHGSAAAQHHSGLHSCFPADLSQEEWQSTDRQPQSPSGRSEEGQQGVSTDHGPHLAWLQVGGLYQLERLTHHNILILQPAAHEQPDSHRYVKCWPLNRFELPLSATLPGVQRPCGMCACLSAGGAIGCDLTEAVQPVKRCHLQAHLL